MYFDLGRMPEYKTVRRAIMLAVISVISLPSFAGQNYPLTIAEAEDRALEAEPGQQALRARAAALEDRAVAAGELPEPTLRVGLNNFPIQSGGFTTEGMTQAAVGLRQAFPAGRTRSINTRRFDLMAAEMNENAEARGRDVLTAARKAWLDLYYWEVAHDLVRESRPFFADLATITRSLYAVGRKSQQDVLRAELELSRLDDRLIEMRRQRARAEAVLGEWIGRDAIRPVARSLPDWHELPAIEAMQVSLQQHPLLLAADSKIEARGASVDLANEQSKPDWALDIGYGYRDGFLPSGTPRSDFVTVGVTVGLPFLRKKSVDRNLSAALQDRSAAQLTREQVLRGLQSQLTAEHAQWEELSRRLLLYDTRILGQARDHAESSLLSYQSDRGDFADVMRGYIDDLNTRIEHVRLQVERAQSYAVLANLGGFSK